MVSKDQIIGALPALTPDDLKAIQALIGGLLSETGASDATGDLNAPEAWLRDAMAAVLGCHSGTWASNNDASRAFAKNASVAIGFIQQHFAGAFEHKGTALALMRYLVLLLVDNLRVMKVPVGKITLAQNLHRLGEVFNDSFPGYGESKAAMLIMANLMKKT